MSRGGWVLAILVAAAAPATAASVPASSLVHACVRNESGLTRIVPAGESCRHGEHLVVWNVAGPQGPAGPAGPQGVAGPQGPAGSEGSAGPGGGHGTREIVGQLVIEGLNDGAPSPVYSVDVGVTSTVDTGGGGGAGKAVFKPFGVLKPVDALSPKLMLATATGKHYTKATIEIFDHGGSEAPPS